MTKIKCYNENEMYFNEKQLKKDGYKKTSDCMWVKIYTKENSEISLIREY
jgi:hypothetical protein